MTGNRRTPASRARVRAIRRRMAETKESYNRAARVVDALAAGPQRSSSPSQDQVALAGEVLRYIDVWCGNDLGRFTHAMPPVE
ncbi:hypothetical protein [Actinocorallia populi]|uniref:hypothetical protein n=1 Tax=Actinocorallia populi TaxID=2079200 RepID=UPI000D08FA09|nr:hypothetical protein [Actinocorallia populi]